MTTDHVDERPQPWRGLVSPLHAECPCKVCSCCCFHHGKCVGGCENGIEHDDFDADDE